MSNYRIIIEPTTEEAAKSLPEELRRGCECSGFVLMADRTGDSFTAIQDIRRMEIAAMISSSAELLACSHIAKAVQEAKNIERSHSTSEFIRSLFDKANGRCEDI